MLYAIGLLPFGALSLQLLSELNLERIETLRIFPIQLEPEEPETGFDSLIRLLGNSAHTLQTLQLKICMDCEFFKFMDLLSVELPIMAKLKTLGLSSE
jgi:hypothetical protein